MSIIKDKTIFDVDKLKPGTAIKFKYRLPSNGAFRNAIILKSREESLEIVQFDKTTKDNTFKNKLHLVSVLNGSLEVKVLG